MEYAMHVRWEQDLGDRVAERVACELDSASLN
jgi:hypothetical protein